MRNAVATVKRGREAPAYPIGSVDNALRLLVLYRKRTSLRVAQAAEHLGVARSTAHRLLAMLEYHDFVRQDPSTHLYVAGPALTDIGLATVRDMDIRGLAHPVMVRLARELGETVHLLTLRGRDALFVDSVESTNLLRVGSRTGMTLPAHATAGGKALLAALSREQLLDLYPRERLDKVTRATIATRALLFRELDRVRERRYAVNVGESENDIGAVAAAIVDVAGRPRASVAVAAPQVRLNEPQIRRFGVAVLRAAREIAAAFA